MINRFAQLCACFGNPLSFGSDKHGSYLALFSSPTQIPLGL